MATSGNYGSYVPSTNIWDVSQLSVIKDPALRELLIRMYQNLNLMSQVLNTKETGYYDNAFNDFVDGNIWFPNPSLSSSSSTTPTFRPALLAVINFGALPNTGSKSVAHGITCTTATTFTKIYATASDTTGLNYIPIPYASPTLANNIELKVDSTNVTIITGSNRTNFNVCYVVLEYLQT